MMSWLRMMLVRVRGLFGSGAQQDAEVRAEMEAHLEMEIAAHIAQGMDPQEARRRAMLAAGGMSQAVERVREQRSLPRVESMVADMRYALRQFRRAPLSTFTIVFVLSLGIGTTVVLFTVLNSLVTMPAPGLQRDESVVRIRGTLRLRGLDALHGRLLSWPEVQEYAARKDLFGSVAAYAEETAVVSTGDGSAAVTAQLIYTTPEYFSILGIRPALGAPPASAADVTQLATSPTAMIGYAMWQQRFGGARDVIGRTVRINGVAVEIVGVAPQRFLGTDGGRATTLWVPLAAYPLLQQRTAAAFISYDSTFLKAAARLRPGITRAQAAPAVAGIGARAFRAAREGAPTQLANGDATLTPGESGSADVVPMLATNAYVRDRDELMVPAAASGGFALLVLLITCTNVSTLMVGLAYARRREIGVRLSLGAPRPRLIRQLLTESVLLALLAAAVGLAVTALGIQFLGATLDDVQLVIDWRVTLATCAIALLAGVLFGLSPALHATRVSVGEVLKSSAKTVTATRSRLQRALVVVQIAFTQPLLVGVGVLIVTVAADIGRRAPGGTAEQIAQLELETWAAGVSMQERATTIDALVARIAALPGVVTAMPMQMGYINAPVAVHPDDRISGITYEVMDTRMVAAPRGYFDAFGIGFVSGRDFDDAEYAHAPDTTVQRPAYQAVIIGSDLARELWGDANPLGRRLTLGGRAAAGAPAMTVVGIVDEATAGSSQVNDRVRIFVPYASMNTGVIVHTAAPALPLLDALRQIAVAEAPRMPIFRLETLAQSEAASRRELLRVSGALAGGGLLALLLSAIGLYAVVSFGVTQRTREIGIRTALGAQRGQIVGMFFRRGLGLSAIGLLLGLPLSIILTRVIVSALSWPLSAPWLLAGAIAAVVLTVAAMAAWIPARRASTIDPNIALRME